MALRGGTPSAFTTLTKRGVTDIDDVRVSIE
jgi:hypothetical protein